MQPRIASLALSFAFAASITTLPAQLSGSYSVDPAGSGARNFKTLLDAGKSVFAQGISGPVLFLIAPGTYTESWFLLPTSGMSSTNTVTFRALIPGSVKLIGGPGD